MARIEAELVIDAGRAVVSLGGALDTSNAHRLGALLRRLIREGCTDIVLDLAAVTRVDAAAIGILRGAATAVARRTSGSLRFCHAPDGLGDVLVDNGLNAFELDDPGYVRLPPETPETPEAAGSTAAAKLPREPHSRPVRKSGRTTRSRVSGR